MTENKTQPTAASVIDFLNSIENEKRRHDSFTVLELMRTATGAEPVMWGANMIGFGHYHYRYKSGREGDSFVVGFSPRKQNLVLYMNNSSEASQALLGRLGKFKTGVSCVYINRLSDVDLPTLTALIAETVASYQGE